MWAEAAAAVLACLALPLPLITLPQQQRRQLRRIVKWKCWKHFVFILILSCAYLPHSPWATAVAASVAASVSSMKPFCCRCRPLFSGPATTIYFYTQKTFHKPFFLLLFEFWPNNNINNNKRATATMNRVHTVVRNANCHERKMKKRKLSFCLSRSERRKTVNKWRHCCPTVHSAILCDLWQNTNTHMHCIEWIFFCRAKHKIWAGNSSLLCPVIWVCICASICVCEYVCVRAPCARVRF